MNLLMCLFFVAKKCFTMVVYSTSSPSKQAASKLMLRACLLKTKRIVNSKGLPMEDQKDSKLSKLPTNGSICEGSLAYYNLVMDRNHG